MPPKPYLLCPTPSRPSLSPFWFEAMAEWDRKGHLTSITFSLRHHPPCFHTAQGMRVATSTTKTWTLRLLLKKLTSPFHRSAKIESYGAFPTAKAPLRRQRVDPRASIWGDFLGFRGSKSKIGGLEGKRRKKAYLKHLRSRRKSCARDPSMVALMGMVRFSFSNFSTHSSFFILFKVWAWRW